MHVPFLHPQFLHIRPIITALSGSEFTGNLPNRGFCYQPGHSSVGGYKRNECQPKACDTLQLQSKGRYGCCCLVAGKNVLPCEKGTLLGVTSESPEWWRFGAIGSDVGQIKEITLRRARLVLGWVTVSGFNSRCGKFISV